MIAACYWTNDAYKALADRMMDSARAVGLRTVGYFVDNPSGQWRDGDCKKPSIVLRALREHPTESVLFVDADCRFRAYPTALEDSRHDYDFAAYFDGPTKPYSTVVWFRAGAGLKYAERWVEEMKRQPDRPNDIVWLNDALRSITGRRVMHLPPAYCWTEPWLRHRFGSVRPVIEHYAVGEHSFPGNVYQRTRHTLYRG